LFGVLPLSICYEGREMRINYALVLTIFLVGCANTKNSNTSNVEVKSSKEFISSSQEMSWKLLSGTWFGSQPTKEGGIKQEIIERVSNGAYRVKFKITSKNGSISKTEEYGEWGASGSIYFTIFKGFIEDGKESRVDVEPYNYDAYRIITLNNDMFEYEHVTTGNKYTIKRVQFNFDFPN
jgi:hypothetical protein